jgi:hypothetical protein
MRFAVPFGYEAAPRLVKQISPMAVIDGLRNRNAPVIAFARWIGVGRKRREQL